MKKSAPVNWPAEMARALVSIGVSTAVGGLFGLLLRARPLTIMGPRIVIHGQDPDTDAVPPRATRDPNKPQP